MGSGGRTEAQCLQPGTHYTIGGPKTILFAYSAPGPEVGIGRLIISEAQTEVTSTLSALKTREEHSS